MEIILVLALFLCGSLMFSYIIGTLWIKKDIRTVGDGNPGASNVLRTGTFAHFALALVLDYAKGFLPLLYLLRNYNIEGLSLVVLSIAPIAGHAFSPFLRGRGGKAVAVTFGVWSALTLWRVPLILGGILTFTSTALILKEDGWRVIMGMIGVLLYLRGAMWPLEYQWIWLLNLFIIIYRYRDDLSKPIWIEKKSKPGDDL